MATEVWIVQHDESAHNTVLGVFGTSKEAQTFADEIGDQFEGGVLFSSYAIGYRFDRGTGHVSFGPGESR
jgi:hypothetical protein